jgi:hypothetical protein
MIAPEKLVEVRKLARARMRKQRERDRAARLPSTREIDNALRAGLAMFLANSNLRRASEVKGHPIFPHVLSAAVQELNRRDFDMKNRAAIKRFWNRLGVFVE